MNFTGGYRKAAGSVLVISIVVLFFYQFPHVIGASNSFVASGDDLNGISSGTLVFMQSGTEYQVRPGSTASFIHENEETGEREILTRTVLDDRVEDGERELNVRDADGEGAIWLSDSNAFRVEMLTVPLLGFLVAFLSSLEGIILLIFLPAAVLLYTELIRLWDKLEA